MRNTFGNLFRITTWGESHGMAIGCIVDGCPAALKLSAADIQGELDKRRPGQSSVVTGRGEPDTVEILSGVFLGKTLGTPISLQIKNRDSDSSKYEYMIDKPRPGHADFTWREKFGFVDWRGGGRASARETAARVAGGAVAKKLLQGFGIEIIAYAIEIAGIRANMSTNYKNLRQIRKIIDSNPVRAPDPKKAGEMEQAILDAKSKKDSVGGVIEAVAIGVPSGLGEPVFDKLDADIAKALMSIPAVKGIEIGTGFELAKMKGSEANDPFFITGGETDKANNKKVLTKTNNCGGILGGISNGMPIIVRVAIKPTSSIETRQETVNLVDMEDTELEIIGRHDPCIVPRAVPVVEAMMALVLADHGLISGLIPRSMRQK